MAGLMIAIGKEKPKDDAERSYAKEAYGALKDGDEEGFVEAFLGAVRACVKGYGEGGAKEPDADDEE